jgi:hypothetical protein
MIVSTGNNQTQNLRINFNKAIFDTTISSVPSEVVAP